MNEHKKEVIIQFEGRTLPLTLNGSSGVVIEKRKSPIIAGNHVSIVEISSEIVQGHIRGFLFSYVYVNDAYNAHLWNSKTPRHESKHDSL